MKKKQGFSVMAAALLLTLAFIGAGAAFTGCSASDEGDSTDAGPGTGSGPGTGTGTGPVEDDPDPVPVMVSKFSGIEGDNDSVIDVIKSAANGSVIDAAGVEYDTENDSLTLTLAAEEEPEPVVLGGAGKDLPAGGLVLSAVPYILHAESGYITADHANWGEGSGASPANSPANVTIDGGERVIDLTGTATGSLITVGKGVTLTLKNITFKGLNPTDDSGAVNTAALIKVQGYGALILDTGAFIKDNTTTSNGGDVYLTGSGHLTMKDGSEICFNSAPCGGGVYSSSSSAQAFNMTGGAISNNTATATLGGGKGEGGGGVYMSSGNFNMTGGAISNNTATSGRGGGVTTTTANSSFTMNSGEIKGNTAQRGGGVYIYTSTFVLTGNGEIKNNTGTQSGGGVYIYGSTFELTGGLITENTANENDWGGGGVAVDYGTFTMTGGTISLNQAKARGGGVWTSDDCKFGKSGGIIYGFMTADGLTEEDPTLANTAPAGFDRPSESAAIRIGNGGIKKLRKNTSDAGNELYFNYDGVGTSNNWD